MDGDAAFGADLTLLIDHDNARWQSVPLVALLTAWIDSLGDAVADFGVITIAIRAYGGWYSGHGATDARYRAADFYQFHCPSVFRVGRRFCRVSFAFADSLVAGRASADAEPVRITHTVADRAGPTRFMRRPGAACAEPGCELPLIRRWLRNKAACTKRGCPRHFSEVFLHPQQKQVDVHLAVDLVAMAEPTCRGGHLGLLSDDSDLLPAVLYAAIKRPTSRAISLLRTRGHSDTYLDRTLRELGVQIVRVPANPRKGG
jgi:hypothetical protein